MAATLVDRVKIYAGNSGTGAIKLGSAVASYRGTEALTDGKVYSYVVEQDSAYEYGRGTYLASTKTLTRVVLGSSTGGGAINLKNNAVVSFTALAEDLNDVTLTADVQAAAASIIGDAAQVATDRVVVEQAEGAVNAAIALVVSDVPYVNAYASTLPKGVVRGTVGGTAVTGATVGEYLLTPTGGSITGSVAYLVVTSATAATIRVDVKGLGSGTTPPAWANPSGATLPAGTTLTAVVDTIIPDQKAYWAITSDGQNVLAWRNNGGSIAPLNDTAGDQVKGVLQKGVAVAISRSQNSVPFADLAGLNAATSMISGDKARVRASDTGTHTAVSGEIALGGAAATVGAAIPNAGDYAYNGTAWLRTGDLDSQTAGTLVNQVNASLAQMSVDQVRGRPAGSAVTGTGAPQAIFVHNQAISVPAGLAAHIDQFWVYNPSGSAKTLRLGAWAQSGSAFTEQASPQSIIVPAGYSIVTGLNIPITNAQKVGLYTPAGGFSYLTGTAGDSGGYYSAVAVSTDTSFTSASPQTGIQLQWGALVRYVSITEARMAAAEAGITANSTANAKVASSFSTQTVSAATNAESASFAPTGFWRWAVGADVGLHLVAGKRYSYIGFGLQPTTGAVNVCLNIYERDTAAGTINDAPAGADTLYFSTTLSLAALALVIGAYSEARFPINGLTFAAGKSYIFDVTVLDSGGAATQLGRGRGPASLAQQRWRGWYATSAAAAVSGTATAISSTGSLSWTAYEDKYVAATQVDLAAAAYIDVTLSTLNLTAAGALHKNGADTPLNTTIALPAAATGKQRVDLIALDRAAQTMSRVAGTERDANLDAAEWQGTLPSGSMLLARVLVGDTTAAVVDASDFRGLIKVAREGEHAAHVQRNRAMLRRTLGKANRGAAIKLGGYGDSITALQDTTLKPAGTSAYVANGAWRDRRDYYFTSYPSDTKALIPLYAATALGMADDGAGAVHMKIGWNWALRDALMQIGGAAVSYYNYGIGGTTSQNTTDNGLYASRIAAALADALDAAVIAFGMNERGQTYTYANIVAMIGQFLAVNTECVVMGVPRPYKDQSLSAWQYTNDALEAAAIDAGAAYISTAMIADDRNLGGIGLPAEILAATNILTGGKNHPGLFEHQQYGRAAVAQMGL